MSRQANWSPPPRELEPVTDLCLQPAYDTPSYRVFEGMTAQRGWIVKVYVRKGGLPADTTALSVVGLVPVTAPKPGVPGARVIELED